MHLVELHAQVGDAAARAFALLQVEQVGVAVLADAAQFVQLGIDAGGDDAAFAQQHRRLVGHGAQGVGDVGRGRQGTVQRVEQRAADRRRRGQRRQRLQREAQPGQLARAHLAQRDARGDALHVADLPQGVAQRLEAVVQQPRDGVVALRGLRALAQRVRQPVAQAAAAHAAAAAVQQRQQRRRVLAAQRARQLQVAVRGRRQLQQIAGAFDLEPGHVAQRLALGVLGKAQQRRCRGMGQAQGLRVVAGQRRHLQLFAQLALAQRRVELPGRPRRARRALCLHGRRQHLAVEQDLGRVQPRQPRGQLALGAFAQAEPAAGQPQPGQTVAVLAPVQRQQQRVGALGHQRAVGHGAGRDHAHHLAFHRTLGGGHVAHLLGHGHRLAQLDQPRQVGLDRMHRHAGHDHRLAAAGAAGGQRDVEQPVRLARIVVEQLVEVAHAVEHQRVRKLRLDAQVLRHHRRVDWRKGRCRAGRRAGRHRGRECRAGGGRHRRRHRRSCVWQWA